MDALTIALIVLGSLVAGGVLMHLILKKQKPDDIRGALNEEVRNALDQILNHSQTVLTSHKEEIKIDLDGKKSEISSLIKEIRQQIKDSDDRVVKSEEERIKNFSSLKQEIDEHKKITGELKVSTEQLRSLLSNNQLRGAFGEQVAENLLKMAGFVKGQDYDYNKQQDTQSTRPDFTIFLPDQTKINIDVKFPYSALINFNNTDDKAEKKKHLAQFKADVREKIKQVSERGYINPEEKTVDFCILFIPNEMIFSFIYERFDDIWEEAMRKKVILAGPFSFTAILRMVKQAYTNFRYQKNLHQIIGLIEKFSTEYQKYNESVDTLGKRIESVSSQFDTVSKTRDRALTRVIDKIQDHNIIEDKDKPSLLDKDEDNLRI